MAKPVFEAQTGETVFAEKVAVDCWKTPGQRRRDGYSMRCCDRSRHFCWERFCCSDVLPRSPPTWVLFMGS